MLSCLLLLDDVHNNKLPVWMSCKSSIMPPEAVFSPIFQIWKCIESGGIEISNPIWNQSRESHAPVTHHFLVHSVISIYPPPDWVFPGSTNPTRSHYIWLLWCSWLPVPSVLSPCSCCLCCPCRCCSNCFHPPWLKCSPNTIEDEV